MAPKVDLMHAYPVSFPFLICPVSLTDLACTPAEFPYYRAIHLMLNLVMSLSVCDRLLIILSCHAGSQVARRWRSERSTLRGIS